MPHFLSLTLLLCIGLCQSPAAASIDVHCQGEGPRVYLIGGGPGFTTWNLQPVQDRLSAHYRVCRWDMRGVGDNAGLPQDPQTPALFQWLQDMREVLPPEPVVLWGHSWGALQVLLFTRAWPDRVSRLILSNPVDPDLRSLEGIERKRFNHRESGFPLALEDIGTPVEQRHNLRRKIASYFADARQGWAYASQFDGDDTNGQLNIRIWKEYRESPLTGDDMRKLADTISGVVYCRQDVLQPESSAEYGRWLGDDKLHELTGCAHFPWEENPEAYYPALLRLIAPG